MPPPSNASPPPATVASPPPPTPTYHPPARPTPPASSPPLSSSPSPPQPPPSNSPPSTSPPPPPPSFTTPIPSPPSGSTPRPPSGRNSPPIPPPEVTGTARSPPSTSSSSTDNSNGISTGSVVGIVIGLGGVILLVILCIICIRCKSKKGDHSDPPLLPPGPKPLCHSCRLYNWLCGVPSSVSTAPPEPTRPPTGASLLPPGTDLGFTLRKFTHEQLSSATDGFSGSNFLGQGGFGYVYRGVLEDGIEVAVKQLRAGSGQGEREFQTEVEIISRVHHKHLISLVGYCKTETQTIIVYEFVPNNTLEFHLHGKKSTRTLNCSERLKISQGTAKGLAYLHEECPQTIIHRDIKAANILLDKHLEAKVADFGLAKITGADAYASRLLGTFGYMAPEYASSGRLTVKSDVFSFGVVLLELITGRRPVVSNQSLEGNILVDWARPLLTQALKDKKFDALVDPRLPKDYDPNEMARMVACAAACVQHSEWCRPRMSQVVMALEGNIASLSDLNEGMRPGPSSVCSSYRSSDYDTVQHNEDLKKIKLGFSSQEYSGSTGQYSNTTSEYGLNPSVSSSDAEQTREIEMERMKNSCGGKLHGEQLK